MRIPIAKFLVDYEREVNYPEVLCTKNDFYS